MSNSFRKLLLQLLLLLPLALLGAGGAYLAFEVRRNAEDVSARLSETTAVKPGDWASLALMSQNALNAGSRNLFYGVLTAFSVALVLLFAGFWKLTEAVNRRKQAEAKMRQLNLDWERLLLQRTEQLRAELGESKRTEAQMREQCSALTASANAVVITDADAAIQWANPAFTELTGYSLEEALGKRPRDLLYSGLDDDALYQSMWEAISNGQVWRGELISKRKDGTLYNEEMTITPVFDEQGHIIRFISVKTDISLRKRLELRQIAQFLLLEKAVGDLDMQSLLNEMSLFIETQAPALRCAIFLANETEGVLHLAAAPNLPDSYKQLVDGMSIVEGCGCSGAAAVRKETVIVSDVRNDSLWASCRHLLPDDGWLCACWSMPIFDSQSRLLGTFDVYANEFRAPSPDEAELISFAVSLSGLLIERKQANESLRKSEKKLANVLDSVEAFIYIKDRSYRYQYANRHVCELFDKSLDEVVGCYDESFFDDSTAKVLRENDRRVIELGERLETEEINTELSTGKIKTFLSSKIPLKDADGHIYALCGISTDISDRKKTENELREKEFLLAESQRIAHVGSWRVDLPEGNITWSEEAYRIFGVRPETFKHSLDAFYKLIHADDRPAMQEWTRACQAGEQPSELEFRIVHPDGGMRIISGSGYLQRDAANLPLFMMGTVQDITGRKQAEERIVNLNRVYTMLSNINQTIVRLRDIDKLYDEACRIAVEDGGFVMAWIGVTDTTDNRMLRPVASAGRIENYLDTVYIPLDDGKRGNGPSGRAFREGRHICCNDIEHDANMGPWRIRALELGYRSSIAIPVKVKGMVRGVYNLYAAQNNFFNDEEIKLLNELACDIALALEVSDLDAERRNSERHLRQAAAVFDNTREGIMVTDLDLNIIMVNQAFTDLTGYTAAEALGQKPSLLSSGRQDQSFYSSIWSNINATGHWQGEIWNRRKNGEIFPELLSISSVKDETGHVTGYVGVFADISKIKASEAELEYLAHHDPLTGLPNRLLLLSRLDHAIEVGRREKQQLALLMIDLDRFKDINDSFGHLVGDELLQHMAAQLKERLRITDTVTRLGGDEFTVLLEDISRPEDAARIANEIIVSLSEPWRLSNSAEVRIGASIGISLFPQHGDSAVMLLQQADAALYQAKLEGRGCFKYFSENLTRAARERIEIESQLRLAISQSELRVFFQPQVEISSGRIIGAEALLRWQHPVEGFIPPSRFIPVAEETGLIDAIGEWVLKETCRQGQLWIEAGLPPLTLAVNVSTRQFLSNDIASTLSDILADTSYPAACLELELTESTLMTREEESVAMLNRLRAIGVRLAIDDFGTGYSSLAYLKRFPLDVLKIDKSFVDDIPESFDDMQIASTIIAIAKTLRLRVLAEGVETAEQLVFLKDQGCDIYQGYLKSPPLPPDKFEDLIKEDMEERLGL